MIVRRRAIRQVNKDTGIKTTKARLGRFTRRGPCVYGAFTWPPISRVRQRLVRRETSKGCRQRLSSELRSLSPTGNRLREQLQALLSQREIVFQLPLYAHSQIL